jgi:hypothetical protein
LRICQLWFNSPLRIILIDALGLAKEYKKNVTDISKWLHHFLGLAFLNPEDVGDSFAVDLIPDMPSDNKVQLFADYVLSTYVDDNAMYPPSVWGCSHLLMSVTFFLYSFARPRACIFLHHA